MTMRTPPPTASIATPTDGSTKLHAPSAERNMRDVCKAIQSIAPPTGNALEIASGTGQHIIFFASAMPQITWHPTEVDTTRIASIQAYINDTSCSNIAAPRQLNATVDGWNKKVGPMDIISLCNLLHLISTPEAETLICEAAKALTPHGKLFIYGPFKRDGKLISEGDKNFDASIRASDVETGYKDDAWAKSVAMKNGLALDQAIEMPANNLALVFAKPS